MRRDYEGHQTDPPCVRGAVPMNATDTRPGATLCQRQSRGAFAKATGRASWIHFFEDVAELDGGYGHPNGWGIVWRRVYARSRLAGFGLTAFAGRLFVALTVSRLFLSASSPYASSRSSRAPRSRPVPEKWIS